MSKSWEKLGIPGPIKLMNKDNAAAAAAGPSTAQKRAEAVSEEGAVKLTSLAGAIFNHKDQKKGQQDSLNWFMENKLGYTVKFPDTSNVRFQSHCKAAAELIVNLELYIQFLELVKDKKEKRNFNHMEKNVYAGLKNKPTETELRVLTLYSLGLSHPYMRQVRGPDRKYDNALDLGPLHDKVKAHCKAIISNPDLLLGDDASYELGSLDGQQWHRPEAFYAAKARMGDFPHLRGALVAFFEGALETWERLTSEFATDGHIATSSGMDRARSWMKTTNDDNEGLLGQLRTGSRDAPNMSLHQRNSRVMLKKNNTDEYIQAGLSHPSAQEFLHAEARRVDSSGLEKKRRQAQVVADQIVVDEKHDKDQQKALKKKKVDDELDKVVPRVDVDDVKRSPGTNADLKLQLAWYRQHDPTVPLPSKLKVKKDMIDALVVAVERYNIRPKEASGIVPFPINHPEAETDKEIQAENQQCDSDVDSDADMELGWD